MKNLLYELDSKFKGQSFEDSSLPEPTILPQFHGRILLASVLLCLWRTSEVGLSPDVSMMECTSLSISEKQTPALWHQKHKYVSILPQAPTAPKLPPRAPRRP